MADHRILDNLSAHLKNTIAKSISLATSLGHESVSPIHLFVCLFQETGAIGSEILKKCGVTEEMTSWALGQVPTPRYGQIDRGGVAFLPDLDESAKHVLEKAMLLSYEYAHSHVGTEHLLYGICQVKDALVEQIFHQANIHKKQLLGYVKTVLENNSKFPDLNDVAVVTDEESDDEDLYTQKTVAEQKKKLKSKRATALELFSTHLTGRHIQEDIDPVVGREKEIDRLIHILARRTKNNPVLIGEPGVGKTAIVEGLAKRIMKGQVPPVLRDKHIYSLDLALMISGTIYRGEFEARLKQVIDDVAARGDAILFIDELHNIIGAGSNQGTMDAANMLKPALARGELRCIGATTLDEYKKYIGGDAALERRFQSIHVEEPSQEETKKILKGIKRFYEKHHDVTIDESAIDAAVTLSIKYVHENFLPDKAIDLLDEGAAFVSVSEIPSSAESRRSDLTIELRTCEEEKEEAIIAEEFDLAMKLKKREEELLAEIAAAEKDMTQAEKKPAPVVDRSHIAHVLSQRLGVDERFLVEDDWTALQTLGPRLSRRIIGQEGAIETLVRTLHQAQLRPAAPRPHASVLFAGPSGVGKTTLAKELAKTLYHDEKALIKLDMSEFSESHSTSKLLGSPAGYVGHKERNRFTEKILKRPYSVILFDEIDKAHADVVKLLLQILGEGTLTDSAGKTISFAHAIIILTTNAGAELFKSSGIGFGQHLEKKHTVDGVREKQITEKLKETLGASLIARLDAISLFSPLTKETTERIIAQQLTTALKHIRQTHALTITPHKRALRHLSERAFNPDLGARAAERLVNDVLAELVLDALQQQREETELQLDLQTDHESLCLRKRLKKPSGQRV